MTPARHPLSRRRFWRFVLPAFVVLASFGQATNPEAVTARPRGLAVDLLEPLTLGGVEQWVLIRSRVRGAPLLLWLHGGPGSPTMPLAHRYDGGLLDAFTVVHWDQRGAGKSFSPGLSPGALHVENFVADALELTDILRRRFDQPKIYLVGHSWGAVLGALSVAQNPEPFYAFVGVSQPVNLQRAYGLGYKALLAGARRTGNDVAAAELRAVGSPPWRSLEPLLVYGRWAAASGGVVRGLDPAALAETQARSPYYTAGDAERSAQGSAFSTGAMLTQVLATDLVREVRALGVPVYLFSGRHDLNSPGSLAESWLAGVRAPRKAFVWFEHSAHFPMWEEPTRFVGQMLRVKEETFGKQ